MIYLDAHVVAWMYAYGGQKLSERALELIEDSPYVTRSCADVRSVGPLWTAGKGVKSVGVTPFFSLNSDRFEPPNRNARFKSSIFPVTWPSTQVGDCNDLNPRCVMSVYNGEGKSSQEKTSCPISERRPHIRVVRD